MLKITMRRSASFAIAVAAVSLIVSCSDKTAGNAQAGGTVAPTGTTVSTTDATTTSTTGAGTPLADTDPCALLSSDAAAQLGITGVQGVPATVGQARDCKWRLDGSTVDDSYTFTIGILDELGLKDVPADAGDTPVPTVGTHQAVKGNAGDPGACIVIMGVTDSSRVEAQAVGAPGPKPCELALKLAQLVEPKLP